MMNLNQELKIFIKDYKNILNNNNEKQLIMFLGSKVGCGKSTVIKSFIEFVIKWKLEDRICLTGTTGVAAININGSTVHLALGLSIKKKQQNMNNELKNIINKYFIIIIDEVSMMGKSLLLKISIIYKFILLIYLNYQQK